MNRLSFIDFLDRYGEKNKPSLLYQVGQDFGKWQRAFRQKLDGLMGPVPDRVEPAVEVVESITLETHTRHLLRIPVNEFTDLPAYLLVPSDVKEGEKRPGILALHGHATFGMESIAGLDTPEVQQYGYRAYGREAVEAGFVVLCPAWWGWPGRDGHIERVGKRDKCNVIQMAAGMYGVNVIALHIQDGQAALDVLTQRPEVDPTRIGCMGNSYGGRTTMWVTICDDRIRACVPSGCMNTFRERSLKLSSCALQYLPGVLQYGDVPELFSLIAPRPMQLMTGEKDGLITDADRDAMIATVRRAYEAAGASDNLDYALHPGGHMLVWDLAEPFLRKHLGLDG
ncbi:MAG: prolyl oligopeptidase family serine peptidase [Planctomycetes bacterium]|nr:prolyl oligopeptidase family serine peptidase [Planctomycetota bacterium]